MLPSSSLERLRRNQIASFLQSSSFTSDNMSFISKYYEQHLPRTLSMLKVIAGSKEKLYEMLANMKIKELRKNDSIYNDKDKDHSLDLRVCALVEGQAQWENCDAIIPLDLVVDVVEKIRGKGAGNSKGNAKVVSDEAVVIEIDLKLYEEHLKSRDFEKIDQLTNILDRISGYKRLDSIEKLQKLSEISEINKNKGEILVVPNDTMNEMFLIQEGKAAYFYCDKQSNQTIFLSVYSKGEILNDSYGLLRKPCRFGITIITDNFKALKLSKSFITSVCPPEDPENESAALLKSYAQMKVNHSDLLFTKICSLPAVRMSSIQSSFIDKYGLSTALLKKNISTATTSRNMRKFNDLIGVKEPEETISRSLTSLVTHKLTSKNFAVNSLNITQQRSLMMLQNLGNKARKGEVNVVKSMEEKIEEANRTERIVLRSDIGVTKKTHNSHETDTDTKSGGFFQKMRKMDGLGEVKNPSKEKDDIAEESKPNKIPKPEKLRKGRLKGLPI